MKPKLILILAIKMNLVRIFCVLLLCVYSNCVGNLFVQGNFLFYDRIYPLEAVKNSFLMIYLIDTESETKEKTVNASGSLYLAEYDEEFNENAKVRLMPIPFPRQETIFESWPAKDTPLEYKRQILVPGCNHIFPFPIGERILELELRENPPDDYKGVVYPFQRTIPIHLKENETAILEVNLVTHANEMKVIKTPEKIMDQLCK
jgi:hypothetical protein